jgi:anthranilate synthase/aminodeoxychorismate synthase-like glutamine amidotransferase
VLLLLDNYDSFTYNLQDYFSQLGFPCKVVRNDEITLTEIAALAPSAIILSPGPETPAKAGIMPSLIRNFYDKIPLLGICLGHQAIGEFFGATLLRAEKPMHGKTSMLKYTAHPVFEGLNNPFSAMRYHSLILENLHGTSLQTIATSESGEIMAFVHTQLKICGIQFHPESILTPGGIRILDNWLIWAGIKVQVSETKAEQH